MIRVSVVDGTLLDDVEALWATDDVADRCWCMWFIIPYKEFHPAGRSGNRLGFIERVADDPNPMGLVAFEDDRAVGWCAVGPRSRFERATKAPTLRHRTGSDDSTWLVPCFFVHAEHRGRGVAAALLAAAVDHATAAGAAALEGFPLAGTARRRSGSDLMTGNEALFAAAGFEVDHRPSTARVVMRRQLGDAPRPQTSP